MIAKNCDGKVPQPGAFTDADRTILASADALYAKARDAMDRQAIKTYLDAVWTLVGDANRYFAAEEPWAKRKTDFQRMETILYVTAEAVRQVALLSLAVMPKSGAKLLDLLGQPDAGRLEPGAVLPAPSGVFPRYVDQGDPGDSSKRSKGSGA